MQQQQQQRGAEASGRRGEERQLVAGTWEGRQRPGGGHC